MKFGLSCDSCQYSEEVEKERSAYSVARTHEAEHPAHFVYIIER